ncbi:2-succinyl-5-enolpyruvyl-6-hydroxy-3-cyclohexene- 1-carboxylate synthase [Vibrio zhanjiangensis]|uniref:2-succinyl-5-enolpyruvyl-6-hydroxy-3-cyclohexene-1-carboxylate synthase n=1 Tax=Vibrio zhanjiangensis TaxID=1046128 RepID=A0ABQ6EZ43_9VIBR|nr:2-succinyl-5-enolpyruvyl-6-hydroxy-3-cyclohexene-1-carboxylic-acid synthase [Vibrio zhanjiangensis]GLT17926.1 2-succinyl-5-enolpyruvyl-6-hydroxy-3-cyclohexene- 1-carboxylate synthase [Vibrio zhanjiangensis]
MKSNNQAALNRIWSQVLLEELARLGVEQVCIAPGSRSTPLAIEACDNPKLTLHTHFDERGLAFLAHGLSKVSDKPVAIIVTSGTAVANLLPAIVEANITGEKLVVITADRPVELISCGANQAIVQTNVFSAHVREHIALPTPSSSVPLSWLLTSIDHAMHRQNLEGGVVHINCPFPEPLYEPAEKSVYQSYLDKVDAWWCSEQAYSRKSIVSSMFIDQDPSLFPRRGVVLIGDVGIAEAKSAKKLAEIMGWPCLCDPQSGTSSALAHYDIWLQNAVARTILSQTEVIVQFGSRFVSKRLTLWIKQQVEERRAQYHYISPQSERNNPNHLMQVHHVSEICPWVDVYLSNCQHGQPVDIWAKELEIYSKKVRMLAQSYAIENESVTEIGLATTLENLPPDIQIILGNSLFVRLVDMFGVLPNTSVYSNRGASGIDGLIATSAGIVRSNNKPSILFIGDTSALYDLNSLALLTQVKAPIVIVIINNDGGAIFDLLPIDKAHKRQLYQMPHGYQFECAARQFGLSYQKPTTLAEYNFAVTQHLRSGQGALVLELITPSDQASSQLHDVVRHIDAC